MLQVRKPHFGNHRSKVQIWVDNCHPTAILPILHVYTEGLLRGIGLGLIWNMAYLSPSYFSLAPLFASCILWDTQGVICWITVLEDVCMLISGSCKSSLIWQKETLQMLNRLRLLRWEDYSGLSWWTQGNRKGPYKRELEGYLTQKRRRRCHNRSKMLCCWVRRWRTGAQAKEFKKSSSRSCKRQGNGFFPWASREHVALLTLWFWTSETDFGLLATRTVK